MVTHFKIKCPVCQKLPNLAPQDEFSPLLTLGQKTAQNVDCKCGTIYIISLNGTVFLFNHRYSYYQNVVPNDVTFFPYISPSDAIEQKSLDGTLLILNKKMVDPKKEKKLKEEAKIAMKNSLLEEIKALGEAEKARYEERLNELERVSENLKFKEMEINAKLFKLMNKILDKT